MRISLQSDTFRKPKIPFSSATRSKVTWETLFDRLEEDIPDATPQQQQYMHEQAYALANGNPVSVLALYQHFDEQRRDLYEHNVMVQFLRDYLIDTKGVRPDVVDHIERQLHEAETLLAESSLNYAMRQNTEDDRDAGNIALKAQNLTLAACGVTRSEEEKQHNDEGNHFEFAVEFAAQMTMFYMKDLPPMSYEKNDEDTRSYGFEPDARYEGASADAPRDAFSLDYYLGMVPEHLGAPGDRRSKSPRRRRREPAEKFNGDVRARDGLLKELWSKLMDMLGNEDRVIGRITRTVQLFIAEHGRSALDALLYFVLGIFWVLIGVKAWYYLHDEQMATTNETRSILQRINDALFGATVQSDNTRVIMDIYEQEVAKLSDLTVFVNAANVTTVNFVGTYEYMNQFRGNFTGDFCALTTERSWQAYAEGRHIMMFWTDAMLKGLKKEMAHDMVSDSIRYHQTFMNTLRDPNANPQEIYYALDLYDRLGNAKYTSASREMDGTATLTAIDIGQRLLKLRELYPRLQHSVTEMQKYIEEATRNANLMKAPLERTINLAQYTISASSAPMLLIIKHAGPYAIPLVQMYSMWVDYMYTAQNVRTTVWPVLEQMNLTSDALGYVLTGPDVTSRMGMFLLLNGWRLSWLINTLEAIGDAREPGMQARIRRYASGKEKSDCYWALARVGHTLAVSSPRSVASVLRYGPLIGVGMVLYKIYSSWSSIHIAGAAAAVTTTVALDLANTNTVFRLYNNWKTGGSLYTSGKAICTYVKRFMKRSHTMLVHKASVAKHVVSLQKRFEAVEDARAKRQVEYGAYDVINFVFAVALLLATLYSAVFVKGKQIDCKAAWQEYKTRRTKRK